MNQTNLNEYYPEIATAAVDLCGLKNLVNRADECNSAMKAIELLVKNIFINKGGAYKDPFLAEKPDLFLYDFGTYFGDSVYLFADPKFDIEKQLSLLTIQCSAILACGFWLGFIARAGISIGDLRRKVIDLGGGRVQELRIGTSMVRSHQLQECQKWVGGAVETKEPSKDCYRLEYEVPVKNSSAYEGHKLQAINWVCSMKEILSAKTNEKVYQDKSQIIEKVINEIDKLDGLSNEEKAIRLDNTIKFVEYVFAEAKFPDFEPLT